MRPKQANFYEFRVNPVYILSFMTVRAAQRDTVLRKEECIILHICGDGRQDVYTDRHVSMLNFRNLLGIKILRTR